MDFFFEIKKVWITISVSVIKKQLSISIQAEKELIKM